MNTKGAIPLGPEKFTSLENSYIASITEEGKMLLIDSKDLPILSKGKGNKIINIDKKKFESRENKLVFIKTLQKGSDLNEKKIHVFRKHFEELEIGETVFTQKRTITEADIIQFSNVSWEF